MTLESYVPVLPPRRPLESDDEDCLSDDEINHVFLDGIECPDSSDEDDVQSPNEESAVIEGEVSPLIKLVALTC